MEQYIKNLNQDFVYWGTPMRSGTGDFTFASPVQIKCRKEDEAMLISTSDGREIVSNALIFVDRDLEYNGFLAAGVLTDFTGQSPGDIDNAFQIVEKGSTTNLNGTVELLWVRTSKYA